MYNNRGQAAMEFLMTYGWAILAAVIVIGVLASFGVFSPSTYVPNRCVVSAPFGCNAGTADSTNGVQLELRNGAGEAVNVTSITVSGCSGTVSPALSFVMPDQNLTVFTIACSPSLTPNQKFQGDITISYTKAGSSLTLTSTGQLVDQV